MALQRRGGFTHARHTPHMPPTALCEETPSPSADDSNPFMSQRRTTGKQTARTLDDPGRGDDHPPSPSTALKSAGPPPLRESRCPEPGRTGLDPPSRQRVSPRWPTDPPSPGAADESKTQRFGSSLSLRGEGAGRETGVARQFRPPLGGARGPDKPQTSRRGPISRLDN